MSDKITQTASMSPFARAATAVMQVTTENFKKKIEDDYGPHADLLGVGSSDVSHVKDLEVICG